MGAHPRAPRAGGSRPDGQHFLRSRLIAAELVRDAGVGASDHVFEIPPCEEMFSPVLAIIPLQLLAYRTATFLGRDVDQPRNLAKSVTVE